MSQPFIKAVSDGYAFKGQAITLGCGILNGTVFKEAVVKVPLRMMNRHGLIAGATGSGKTKTLQILAEQLSQSGVPVLLMDIKGDLSGIAAAGTASPKILERHQLLNLPYAPQASSVEFLTLSNEKGARLRATVSEFGPVLFTKILGLNDTQGGVIAVLFKYCDENHLPLLDLADVKKVLNFFMNDGKEAVEENYGKMTAATVGTIVRKIVELEQQGAEIFFGERSFEVQDLTRLDENGRGMISILRLTDIQDRPKLFSTFMLQMLAEIYATFPEIGDAEQPELVIFIDEAHLVFNEASKTLLNQIETIIKLIRSKGVGVFFCTQNPADIPDAVLGQLGLKIQHSLRAFTAKDRQNIRLAAQNYPLTDFYNTENLLTSLGIGEALITALNEKGIPTPLIHTMLRAPLSRMDVLTPAEIEAILAHSPLVQKYNQVINRESAYEILTHKLQPQTATNAPIQDAPPVKTNPNEKSTFQKVIESAPVRQIGNTIFRELTRGLLGAFGFGRRR